MLYRRSLISFFAASTVVLLFAFNNCSQEHQFGSVEQSDPVVNLANYQFISDDLITDPFDAGSADEKARNPSTNVRNWTGGIIPIRFQSLFTDAEKAIVMAACRDWMAASRLKCRYWNSSFTGSYLYVSLDQVGCYAHYGAFSTQANYVVMNLARTMPVKATTPKGTCITKGIAMHEFGHLLGLIHEHQRPDRDNYVTINYQNMNTTIHYAFTAFTSALNMGGYDFLSIMHYGPYNGSSNGLPTLQVKSQFAQYANLIGTPVLNTELLSSQDKVYAKDTYGAFVANYKGYLDRLTVENGNLVLHGWSCVSGASATVNVRIYANDAAGATYLGQGPAANTSELAVQQACAADGKFRYRIVVPSTVFASHRGKRITARPVLLGDLQTQGPALATTANFVVP